MIDINFFCTDLGASQALATDEQLLLDKDVRLACGPNHWTAIFETRATDEPGMRAVFDISRSVGRVVPFITRSGQLGCKWESVIVQDETADALRSLRAVIRHLHEG